MRRRLLNLLTALSLLLCVAAGVLWVRSYTWKEGLSFNSRTVYLSLLTRHGRLACMADFKDFGPRAPPPGVRPFRRRQSNPGTNLVDSPDYAFAGRS
jgi:hypothetical protein